MEALSAVFGGTQSLHTNSLDEAMALPTDYSAKIARDTQLFLQKDAGVTQAVDPFSGSYYIETLTHELVIKALDLINEVEELGGMTKAIAQGLPKRRIEEAAAKKQGRIDTGKDKIVGVNIFPSENIPDFKLLDVDIEEVRNTQIERLHFIKFNRDNKALENAMSALERIALTGEGNLLEGAIKVARLRGTLGEISLALEKVFGRYQPVNQTISGVYGKELSMDKDLDLKKVKN